MHQAVTPTVNGFLASADATLPAGYSAVLYGSAARGDYVKGRSDVNLMIIAEAAGFTLLRALGPALRRWHEASHEPPLLFTRAEWLRATDVFPIEITDMKHGYELLRGSDPITPVTVNPVDLRQALEGEFRGKLMRMRQAYATFGDEENDLTPLALSSLSSILVLFRSMLALDACGVDGSAEGAVEEAARVAEFPPEPVLEIVRNRDAGKWRCSAVIFEGYVTAVARAAHHMDQLQTGES
ncbi:MAG TPA: nucleotidyltransferase domain-containing protein [Gemmatimonadales bacterium]|jgi:predicted nucleotidyltransferase|nr:nucleotidyltransferase domain-containing protein [Gemmatimonadales bacterium]